MVKDCARPEGGPQCTIAAITPTSNQQACFGVDVGNDKEGTHAQNVMVKQGRLGYLTPLSP